MLIWLIWLIRTTNTTIINPKKNASNKTDKADKVEKDTKVDKSKPADETETEEENLMQPAEGESTNRRKELVKKFDDRMKWRTVAASIKRDVGA